MFRAWSAPPARICQGSVVCLLIEWGVYCAAEGSVMGQTVGGDKGAGLLEYTLIIALLVILVVTAVTTLGQSVARTYNVAAETLSNQAEELGGEAGDDGGSPLLGGCGMSQ